MSVGQLSLKHRTWQLAAIAGLAALLLAAFSPGAGAQGTADGPPHWFWGMSYKADNGAVLRFVNEADGEEAVRTVIGNGMWSITVHRLAAPTGWIEIVAESETRRTEVFSVGEGVVQRILPSEFSVYVPPEPEPEPVPEPAPETEPAAETGSVEARIVARVSDNPGREGSIEFGMRIEGETDVITPRARYFPDPLPESRIGSWLRSSVIDLGNGASGRIIARRVADGRTEFAFDATDGGDCVPSARYFPAEGSSRYPDHNNWLRSPVLTIPTDCTDTRGG